MATTTAKDILDLCKTVATALLIALVLRTVLFQPYTIPSPSMEPALVKGDYVIVSKYSYGWSRHSIPFSPPIFHGRLFGRTPARGDVIVFQLPRDERVTYVKRLIGLPGDRVQVIGGTVLVNGVPIPRAALGRAHDPGMPQATVSQYRETQNGRSYVTFDQAQGRDGDDTGAYRVPAGRYFFMGDNRDNSSDSRWPTPVGVGFVPAENIVGKAQMVLVSWRDGASLLKPWTWIANLQPERFFRPL